MSSMLSLAKLLAVSLNAAIAEMRGGWSGKEVVHPPKSVGPTCVGEDAEASPPSLCHADRGEQ